MAKVPAKTEQVLALLKQRASEMRTVTYGEIAKECKLHSSGTGNPLGYIRDEVCRANGLPWLSLLAVYADTHQPGGRWRPDTLSASEELKVPQEFEEHWWREMVLQVYAYDWSDVALED